MAVVDERARSKREISAVSGERELSKRLLLVAYPLLPVSEASAGGAEQILFTLERELLARGWKTEVAACAGSIVSGQLMATGAAPQALDGFAEREREHTERVVEACANSEFSLVLDHSGHFFRHASRVRGCVLATLHLPRSLYGEQAFVDLPGNVYFNCVSESQRAEFTDLPRMLGVVRNGIGVERFAIAGRKSDYVLWLGRICPEKAPHLAIQAAKLAGVPIVVAGQVYPFRWHEDYWQSKVKPLIDDDRVRWVPLPSFAEKTRLLREARALLVTSQVAETTSLVALEAMASGTPVIAFGAGALSEVVSKETGFIVGSVEEMAEACSAVSGIRAMDCRARVAREYSARAMTDGYEALIQDLEEQKRWQARRG
jgi:glycosyltransferase involved in cell wall biosynthesis